MFQLSLLIPKDGLGHELHNTRIEPRKCVLHPCRGIKYQSEICTRQEIGDLAKPFGEFLDHFLVVEYGLASINSATLLLSS